MAAVADELDAEHLVGALSGACGGLFSATALFPFDLVKTRMQAGVGQRQSSKSAWAIAREATGRRYTAPAATG